MTDRRRAADPPASARGGRLDRLPKDHARCAAAGIVGGDGNSIAIGFAEELHAEAFVKCDGLQI